MVGVVTATILAGATLWYMRRRRLAGIIPLLDLSSNILTSAVDDPESPRRTQILNGSDDIQLQDIEPPLFRLMEWYHDESTSVECQTAWEAELPTAMRYRTEWRHAEL